MTDQEIVNLVSNGNNQAIRFVEFWIKYIHEIDDLVDRDNPDCPTVIQNAVTAAQVYSCDFYHQHSALLFPIILLTYQHYMLSEKLKATREHWKEELGKLLAKAGAEVLIMVAWICWNDMNKANEIAQVIKEQFYTNDPVWQ